VRAVGWYDGWMVSRVSEVRQHLHLLPTGWMRRLGCCHKDDVSKEDEVHVEGGADGRGDSAGRDTTTVHSVIEVGVPCAPAAAARLLRASETASAPRSRTALRQRGPSKPLHRPLEAACGWRRRKDERCIAALVLQWRQPPCASRRGRQRRPGCWGVVSGVSYPHSSTARLICSGPSTGTRPISRII
jgi:hypothetical protein